MAPLAPLREFRSSTYILQTPLTRLRPEIQLSRFIFLPQNDCRGCILHSMADFSAKTRVLRPQNAEMGTPIHSVAIRAEIAKFSPAQPGAG